MLEDVAVDVQHLAAGLEGSSVGVEVYMSDALLYSHSWHDAGAGEGVDGVHELSVVRRQSVKTPADPRSAARPDPDLQHTEIWTHLEYDFFIALMHHII